MSEIEKLDALLAFVTAESRVCPMPIYWHGFYQIVSDRGRSGEFQSLAPFVLGGWWGSSNEAKQERLAKQIQWAFDNGTFEAADRFLKQLTLEQWHHSDLSKPNF